jgi:hypothetical protein
MMSPHLFYIGLACTNCKKAGKVNSDSFTPLHSLSHLLLTEYLLDARKVARALFLRASQRQDYPPHLLSLHKLGWISETAR